MAKRYGRRRKLKMTKSAVAARRRYRARKRGHGSRRKPRKGSAAWLKRRNLNARRRAATYGKQITAAKKKARKIRKRVRGYRIRHVPRAPQTIYDQQVREHVDYLNARRAARRGYALVKERGKIKRKRTQKWLDEEAVRIQRYKQQHPNMDFVAPELRPHYAAMKRGEKY